MAERLLIKNFAGLDIDIELGRINIFIGPQASGKSVCAKCLYLFRSFVPDLLAAPAAQTPEKQSFENSFLNRFREYFPNLWSQGSNFRLHYQSGDAFVEITANPKSSTSVASINYSPFLREAAMDIRSIVRKVREGRKAKGAATAPRSNQFYQDDFYQEYLATDEIRYHTLNRAGVEGFGRQAFVIAGRAFLSTLKGSILTVLANNPVADPLLREFLQLYETVRKYAPQKPASARVALVRLAESIIRGKLLTEGDEDYIELTNEQRIPLANASSGQQEAFSLLMILLDLVSPSSYYPYSALYAEEPEAHLFPESQQALARLMAQVYNAAPMPVQYVITTHSPYLLAVFNNLVYAHQVQEAVSGDPAALKKLGRVVPKAERLSLADFRAYGLENGKARPLINHELGLLSADSLDEASEKINQQFGKLADLDPSTRA